jgi:hypothetical protein
VKPGVSHKQKGDIDQQAGQHFAGGELKLNHELHELGLNLKKFDKISDKLYNKKGDFVFKPRKNVLIDHKIKIILKALKITKVPVIHLYDILYFVGIYKLLIEFKNNFLMIKIGDKYIRFAEYIAK